MLLKVFNPSSSLCHLSLFHLVLSHCFKVLIFFFFNGHLIGFILVENVSMETPRIKTIRLGSKGGTVVRALASPQCGPGSNSSVNAICGLSLLLVLQVFPFSPLLKNQHFQTLPIHGHV